MKFKVGMKVRIKKIINGEDFNLEGGKKLMSLIGKTTTITQDWGGGGKSFRYKTTLHKHLLFAEEELEPATKTTQKKLK